MAYSTQSDILNQMDEVILIQLTDDSDSGSVDPGVVNRAITDADEEISSALAVKYSLPLATTPPLARKMSVDLAICNLYARRLDTIPEERKDRCEEARTMLDKLARGDRKLEIPEPAVDPDYGVEVSTVKSDRVFSLGRSSDGSLGSLDNY